jgi:DNA-binding IscR family transcriptional regulator
MTLTQLVDLLEKSHGRFSLDELSRALEVPPGALAGMIETLVRKGVLLEIGPDGGWCAACGLRNDCNLLAVRGARYVVVPRRKAS